MSPLLVRLRDTKDNWLHAHQDIQLIPRRAAGHVSCQTGLTQLPNLRLLGLSQGLTECTGLHLWWQD